MLTAFEIVTDTNVIEGWFAVNCFCDKLLGQ